MNSPPPKQDSLKKIILLSIGAFGLIAVVLIALGALWLKDAMNPYNDALFDSKVWRDAEWGSSDRDPMAEDLIKHHIHAGMTTQQIEQLLGPPDDEVSGPKNHNGLPIPGSYSFRYSLGSPPSISWDDAFVYIHFNNKDEVIAADIHGY